VNAHTAKFCSGCGAPLLPKAATVATEPVPSAPALNAYTPAYLADKILTTRSALEGERKQVTVLFVDVADSSMLAQRIDAEILHRLMGEVLQLVAEAVHRYEGTVNQYLGDGLMGLFGAPFAVEDHPLRAVQAALAIQETIRGYSAQVRRDHGVELRLRVGLNTGSVVVGRIGDDLRMDYTAVGNTTHIAFRMQALAEPGAILMAEETHRFVEGYVFCESLGPVDIKGQREPVTGYRISGRRRWRSRLEMSAARGLTQFAGRRRELALLHDCLLLGQFDLFSDTTDLLPRILFTLENAIPLQVHLCVVSVQGALECTFGFTKSNLCILDPLLCFRLLQIGDNLASGYIVTWANIELREQARPVRHYILYFTATNNCSLSGHCS